MFCTRTFLISFFVSLLFAACRPAEESATIVIVWQNGKAIGISIPKSLLKDSGEPEMRLKIQLTGGQGEVLGTYKSDDDAVVFEPVVPLTRGLQYDVLFDGSLLSTVDVPKSDAAAPELIEVYPTQDTLPENLLKIYLKFSQPMEEGRSLNHIFLLKDNLDTMKGTFLDLQPELWNNDGTILTLWLDPGRIKRDLIPNKILGAPLEARGRYTLHVSVNWKSKEGVEMEKAFEKTFLTSSRDDQSPAPDFWKVKIPAAGSTDPLIVDVVESLDYSLLNDAIQLVDKNDVLVVGRGEIENEERSFRFVVSEPWKAGDYILRMEGRLEDLAGNNLNRPFDRDLKAKEKPNEERKVFERKFTIR